MTNVDMDADKCMVAHTVERWHLYPVLTAAVQRHQGIWCKTMQNACRGDMDLLHRCDVFEAPA